MLYNKKIVQSGNVVEVYEYENYMLEGYQKKATLGRAGEADEEEKKLNRKEVQGRARRDLRRLINANVGHYKNERGVIYPPVFLTLTFAENVTDLDKANCDYKKFIQRLNYHVTGEKKNVLKYVVVVEFQKRGAIHYHAVIFNLPYIKVQKIAELWGQGFVKANKITEVDNIGSYVSKYMGKDLQDDRLAGEKCYFSSRGLLKPIEYIKENEVEQLAATLPPEAMVFQSDFKNDYTGKMMYRQYNLNRWNMEYRKMMLEKEGQLDE